MEELLTRFGGKRLPDEYPPPHSRTGRGRTPDELLFQITEVAPDPNVESGWQALTDERYSFPGILQAEDYVKEFILARQRQGQTRMLLLYDFGTKVIQRCKTVDWDIHPVIAAIERRKLPWWKRWFGLS